VAGDLDLRNQPVAYDSQIKELINVQKEGASIPDALHSAPNGLMGRAKSVTGRYFRTLAVTCVGSFLYARSLNHLYDGVEKHADEGCMRVALRRLKQRHQAGECVAEAEVAVVCDVGDLAER
jgi:hypothetical protein